MATSSSRSRTDLPAGGSALFLLIKDGDTGLLIAAMRQYEGRVVQTSLDEEQEQALARLAQVGRAASRQCGPVGRDRTRPAATIALP